MVADWHGCYDEGWNGIIVDEAFAHPAKISYALAARIYEHAFKEGWVKRGDKVIDPFGGIGGTAIHAACRGLQWVGVELESRFCGWAEQNFSLWARKWGNLPEWVQPKMVCGDSRRLAELLGIQAVACIGSPPFVDARQNTTDSRKGATAPTKHDPEAWGMVVSSPPYAHDATPRQNNLEDYANESPRYYGQSAGQLGSMPEGDYAVVVSSPPYAEHIKNKNGIDYSKSVDPNTSKRGSAARDAIGGPYGETTGQLGAMVVGSPPFENQEPSHAQGSRFEDVHRQLNPSKLAKNRPGMFQHEYGDTSGNIGNATGETFWSAARQIVEQCRQILRPGGHAIWVCKDFVRKGKRVPFSDQWLALCESLGFRLVCRHRAMLVKHGDRQKLLDGGEHQTTRERKSFFRRMAEKKGSPRIDWEDVICVQRA